MTTNLVLRSLCLGLLASLSTAACGDDSPSSPGGGNTCSIAASGVTSTSIGPVGIVTFTVTGAASLDSAQINFGLDTSYGLSAPVDITTKSSDYRTLLLGMKAERTYHYQVVAKSGNSTCTSPDYTITAGGCPTSIKRPTVTTMSGVDTAKLDGGFLVMEGYRATLPDDYAYILDGDGDLVWCYKPTGFGDLMASRMSWDGQYMWFVHGNTPPVAARMGRVSMDGLTFEDHSSEFTGLNHDAVVLPNDEAIVYIAYNTNGCDDIKEWKPDGTSRTIINSSTVFGNAVSCHCNAIAYDSSDDSVIVSDDDHSAYFKVDRQGTVKWVLGGGEFNSFDKSGGGASSWIGQHNLHILGNDNAGLYHILFFNNGTASTQAADTHAVAIELALDLETMTTQQVWSYDSDPDISNPVLGDVQRLDNGNTLVTYSLAGTIHEVDKDKNLLQTFSWSSGTGSVGYVTKRKTLYGPSPK